MNTCGGMPELPDVVIYIESLESRLTSQPLKRLHLFSPFVLRSVTPPITLLEGLSVTRFRRLGKQIVFCFENDLFLIIHLMIAGRLQWKEAGDKAKGRNRLAALDFPTGTLILTEAGSKKRASIRVVEGEDGLSQFDRGALEVTSASFAEFQTVLRRENHTVKRSLTDPRMFSGIGNAYSDEILHRARLSPFKMTSRLSDEEIARLHEATTGTMVEWVERLREQNGGKFPSKVTAFRPEMAVHGRYRKPCPICKGPVQLCMQPTNAITAQRVRPAGNFWQIAPCRNYSAGIGRRAWMRWTHTSKPGDN